MNMDVPENKATFPEGISCPEDHYRRLEVVQEWPDQLIRQALEKAKEVGPFPGWMLLGVIAQRIYEVVACASINGQDPEYVMQVLDHFAQFCTVIDEWPCGIEYLEKHTKTHIQLLRLRHQCLSWFCT